MIIRKTVYSSSDVTRIRNSGTLAPSEIDLISARPFIQGKKIGKEVEHVEKQHSAA